LRGLSAIAELLVITTMFNVMLKSMMLIINLRECLQSFIWTVDGNTVDSRMSVPFVVDICRATFEELQQLLTELFDSVARHVDQPPPTQFSECLMSSVLSLLKLQVCPLYSLGSGMR